MIRGVLLLIVIVGKLIAEQNIDTSLFKRDIKELLDLDIYSFKKSQTKSFNIPGSILVYTEDDFKSFPGTRLTEFLRNVVGAQAFYINRNDIVFSLRGSASQFSNKLQVLINDQPITSFPFSGVFWGEYDLPLQWIERIEVLKGQYGSIWGSNNVNGVVNIILKRDLGHQKAISSVGVYQGKPGISVASQLKSNEFSYLLLGEARTLPGHDKSLYFSELDPSDETSIGRAGFILSKKQEGVEFRAHVLGFNTDFNRTVLLYYPPVEGGYLTDEGGGRSLLSALQVSKEISEGKISLDLKNSLQNYRFSFANIYDVVNEFETRYERFFGKLKTTAGFNLRHIASDADNSSNFAFLPEERSFNIKLLFLQFEAPLGDKTEGIFNLGFEDNSYSGSNTSLNLRFGQSFSDNLFGYISMGRAYRLPSRVEHDMIYAFRQIPISENITLPGVLLGNNRVKDEEVRGIDLGARYLISNDWALDLSTYWYTYDNLVTFKRYPNIEYNDYYQSFIIPIYVENNMTGTAKGADVILKGNLLENLFVELGYQYILASSDVEENNTAFIEPELRAPKHALLLKPRFELGRFTFEALARYWSANNFLVGGDLLTLDAGVRFDISEQDSLKLIGRNLVKTNDFETFTFAGYSLATDLPTEIGIYYIKSF